MNKEPRKYRRKKTSLIVIGLVVLLFLFLLPPLIVLMCISDSSPLVEEVVSVDSGSTARAGEAMRQLYKNMMGAEGEAKKYQLSLSEKEINSIVALGMRGVRSFKGRVNVTPFGIRGVFTFYIPENPFGQYINVVITIDPSPKGLVINSVSIGSLDIPGDQVSLFSEFLLNRVFGDGVTGTTLFQSIESLEVDGSKLNVVYRNVVGLKETIKDTIAQVKGVRDDLALLGNPELIKLYYQELCYFHKQIEGMGEVSLGYYLASVFSYAEKRSLVNANYSEENRSALLALSIFVGSKGFDSAIGAIDKETYLACKTKGTKVVLANRKDLRLHFIYSAALKVMTDSGISFTIGEAKELMDSQVGGSGFSFPDLAADRAGIRFAEQALDEDGALRVQMMASEFIREEVFFPEIAELPEGISLLIFEERGGIDSRYYKKHLLEIDNRINSLPLYQ